MKNLFLNAYRKQIKEPGNIEYDENRSSHGTHHDGFHELTSLKRKHWDDLFEDEIAHSLKSLASTFKAIVILRDVEDLTYAEIADVVACPLGTVRSRLHRGRQVLQEKLSTYAQENCYISRKL